MQDDMNSPQTNRVAFEDIFKASDLDQRKTKIIGTLGPACSDVTSVSKLLDAGMQIARVDCSQGDTESL